MNKRKIGIIVFSVLVIGLTVFIFSNSLTIGTKSAEQSGKIVGLVKDILNNSNITLNDYNLSYFVRKMGHFSEFFALGFSASLLLKFLFQKDRLIFLSPVYCYIVALCDEFICQRITAGRSPQLTDTLIDLSGALTATLLILGILTFMKKKKEKDYEN